MSIDSSRRTNSANDHQLPAPRTVGFNKIAQRDMKRVVGNSPSRYLGAMNVYDSDESEALAENSRHYERLRRA